MGISFAKVFIRLDSFRLISDQKVSRLCFSSTLYSYTRSFSFVLILKLSHSMRLVTFTQNSLIRRHLNRSFFTPHFEHPVVSFKRSSFTLSRTFRSLVCPKHYTFSLDRVQDRSHALLHKQLEILYVRHLTVAIVPKIGLHYKHCEKVRYYVAVPPILATRGKLDR